MIDLAKGLPELNELHLEKMSREFSTIAIKEVIEHSKKLSKLHLESKYGIEIDVDDYLTMLKSVQNRPEKIKLLIEITTKIGQVDVPKEVMEENREWFHIDEEITGDDDDDFNGFEFDYTIE